MNSQGIVYSKLMLRNLFNNPQTVYIPGNVDGYMRALIGQPSQTFDQHFTEEVS